MKVNFTKAPEFLLIGERSINSGTIENQNGSKVFRSGNFKQVLKDSEVKAFLAMSSDDVVEPEASVNDDVDLKSLTKKQLMEVAEGLYGAGNVDGNQNKASLIELIEEAD